MKLEQLIKWGSLQTFGSEPLRLNVCSVITDRGKFFEASIKVLKSGKERGQKARLLMPTYERLMVFYNLVEAEKQEKATGTAKSR